MTDFRHVYLACDVSNLWKVCRSKYGKNARINFEVLKNIIPATYENIHTLDLCAYTVAHPKAVQKPFEDILTSLGFSVKSRELSYVNELNYPLNISWQMGISFDILEKLDQYDTFVIVTGNGEFRDLIDKVSVDDDVKLVVITFDTEAAKILYKGVDELYLLEDNIVYQQKGDVAA